MSRELGQSPTVVMGLILTPFTYRSTPRIGTLLNHDFEQMALLSAPRNVIEFLLDICASVVQSRNELM